MLLVMEGLFTNAAFPEKLAGWQTVKKMMGGDQFKE